MAGGVVSFAAIMAVLVLFSVFLTREIRQSQRQVRFIDSVTHELKSPLRRSDCAWRRSLGGISIATDSARCCG